MATYRKIPKARIIYETAFNTYNGNSSPCQCEHCEGCQCDDCTAKTKGPYKLHLLPSRYADYVLIQWTCPGAGAYTAGFRTNDRIVAVNDVFGKSNTLLNEIERPYADTKHPLPNTPKLKFLVMDEECYNYYRNLDKCNFCHDEMIGVSMGCRCSCRCSFQNKHSKGEIHTRTIYGIRDKTLQDLCCDHFKLVHSFEKISKVFEQVNIPLTIQERIKDLYDFHYEKIQAVKEAQQTPRFLEPTIVFNINTQRKKGSKRKNRRRGLNISLFA